jgi:hypothetical protein
MNSDKYYGYGYEKVHKEHIVNVIKELKQQIILIKNKLQELSIFYIINKDKYDYELAKTFFDNLQNFIIINDIPATTDQVNNYKFINYYNDSYNNLLNKYIENSSFINANNIPIEQIEKMMQIANESFNFICNEEEDKLIHLMLMHEKKLNCYENLTELYPKKPEIENIMDLYPEPKIKKQQYSVITCVMFFIMIMFSVIVVTTVVLMVNNYNYNYKYNTDIMLNHIHCTVSPRTDSRASLPTYKADCTRLIDKHNKLKNSIII